MQLFCCDRKQINDHLTAYEQISDEEEGVGGKRGITKGPRQNFGGESHVFNFSYCGGITMVVLLWYFILIIDYCGGFPSIYAYIRSEFLKLHAQNMQVIVSSINVF